MDQDKFAANFEKTYPVRTLRLVTRLMMDILSNYFSGYMVHESDALNNAYVRLAHRASELATGFPNVTTALSDFLAVFPNLYEALDDPSFPEAKWEYSQDVVRILQARVSELYAKEVPVGEDTDRYDSMLAIVMKDDVELIKVAMEVQKRYAKEKREYEQRWWARVERTGKEFQAQQANSLKQQSTQITQTHDERLYDHAHAACIEALIQALSKSGYKPQPEGTYNRYGERGSVDVFMLDGDNLGIYEVWTRIINLNEALRKLDEKARVFPQVVTQQQGKTPQIVTANLVLLATKQNCDLIVQHAATFESRFNGGATKHASSNIFFKLALFDPVQRTLLFLMPTESDNQGGWREQILKWSRFPSVQSFVEAWKHRSPSS